MSKLDYVTADTWQEKVAKADGPILVVFIAADCPHCQAMGPILEQLADMPHAGKVLYASVEQEAFLVTRHHIRLVPAFLLFCDVLHAQIAGELTLDELKSFMLLASQSGLRATYLNY